MTSTTKVKVENFHYNNKTVIDFNEVDIRIYQHLIMIFTEAARLC